MELTHDVLMSLGFIRVNARRMTYSYKGVIGRLWPDDGLFVFMGFTQVIGTKDDLRYLLMLIDYRW